MLVLRVLDVLVFLLATLILTAIWTRIRPAAQAILPFVSTATSILLNRLPAYGTMVIVRLTPLFGILLSLLIIG
ncbi:hypothetical protein CYJ10_24580 [Cupriavidus pauculus]|uniref:Uncharacterized protein n=1 Tax=Cupriavidus pauculus TaxID=82633 RepID=A0A2N5C6V9_9BURK|nr:hypothetical protein CYJ10_24580 [Cupriavidus pauculus]